MATVAQITIEMAANVARLRQDMDAAKGVVGDAMKEITDYANLAKKSIEILGVSFSVIAVGKFFESLVMDVAHAQAGLMRMSEVTGATVEGLSAIRGMAKLTGTDMESVGTAMVKLAKNVETGSAATEKGLNAIGLSTKDLQGLKSDEMYKKIADTLNQYEDGAKKTAVATEVLGKAGAAQLPLMKALAENGDLVAKTTTEQALQAQHLEQNITRLSMAQQAWKKIVGAELVPVLDSVVTVLIKMQTESNGTLNAAKEYSKDGSIKTWAQNTVIALAYVVDAIQAIWGNFKVVGSAIAAIAVLIVQGLSGIGEAAIAIIKGQYSQVPGIVKGVFAATTAVIEAAGKDIYDAWNPTLFSDKIKDQFQDDAQDAGESLGKLKKKVGDLGAAAVAAAKDLAALYDALAKAMTAWEVAALKTIFQINTDDAKVKIKELELLYKQIGGPEAMAALRAAQMKEVELFAQNAAATYAKYVTLIQSLEQKLQEVQGTGDDATKRRLVLQKAIADENVKALAVVTEIGSVASKTAAVEDGIAEHKRVANKAVYDSFIAINYAVQDYKQALDDAAAMRQFEIDLIGKTQLQQDILKSALATELEIRKLNTDITRLQIKLSTELNEVEKSKLEAEIKGVQAKIEARKATEDSVPAALALKKSTTDVADAWNAAAQTSVTFFTDLQTNSSKAFSNVWQTVKKFFVDLAAQFATKFIIQTVLGGTFSGTGIAGGLVNSSIGSASGSALGGLFGGLSSSFISGMGSMFGSAGTIFAAQLTAPITALTNGIAGFASGGLSGAVSAMGGLAGVLGAAIPVVGGIIAAIAALGLFTRKPGFKIDNSVVGVGDSPDHFTQGALGAFDFSTPGSQAQFAPLGKAIQQLDTLVAGALGAETLAQVKTNIQNLSNATHWENLDATGIETATKNFLVQRYATAFDLIDVKIAATIRGFSGSADALMKYVADVIAVTLLLKDNAVYFKSVIGTAITVSELTAVANAGETLGQTLTRVITVFSATNGVAAMLGKDVPTAFGAVGLASIAARQNLVDLAGGIQQLDAMSKSYYDHYYSQAERGALTLKQQNDAVKATFDSLGIATPKSTAEFRALVEAQDLTTAAGRATVAALLKVEGAFYSINTAVSATQSYLQNYYTQAERDALTRKQRDDDIKATFDALGIATPKSTAEFRALVEAQDLTTAAGRKTYAALMLIEDAFYKVNTAAAAVVSSLAYIPLIDQYARGIGPGQRLGNTTDKGPILVRVDPRIKQEADAALGSPGLLAMIAAMGQRSNDGSMGPNGGISPGAGVPVADQNLMKLTLTLRNLESASNQANDTIAKQSNSVLYAYNKQAESMQGLVDMSPRAANAFTSVANGMIAMRDATAAFLVQVDTVKTSIGSMFANTITSLKLSTMTKEEQYAFYQAQAESARQRSLTSTDPLEIQRLAGIVNSSVGSAQSLLSIDQQRQTNPQQIANLEKYNAQIQANLDKVAKDAKDANDAFLARLEAKFTKMTDTQGDISKKNNDAADKQLIAATTTRRFKVDFSSNIPGMVRTSEVGG